MSIYLGQCVCRAVAIRFEVVRFVVRVLVLCSQTPGESLATRDYACVRLGLVGEGRGAVGQWAWSPGKFWNVKAMRLHLRAFLGKYDASQRPYDRVSHLKITTLSVDCVIQQQFGFPIIRLSRKSHPSQMRLLRLIVRLEEWKVVGRKTWKKSFAWFAAILQVSTRHLCAWGPLVWTSAEHWQ